MPLESYLVEGEEVLGQAGGFYATNKRLIRYSKSLLREEWDDIAYFHLSSIGLVRNLRRGLLKTGIVILALALFSLLMLVLVLPLVESAGAIIGSPMEIDITPFIPILLIEAGVGILLLFLGILLTDNFVQFRAPGLSKESEARFRLHGVGKKETKELVRLVRKLSLAGEGGKKEP